MSSSTWHFFLKRLMKYDKNFVFKIDFTSYADIIIHTYVLVPSIKLCLSTQIQCKKNVNTKKFPWNIHLCCLVWVFIHFIFQGDDTTFYIQNMNVLNEKSSLSQHTPLIVTKPPFYTCFHDVQLSLILSYQFNHVHYLLIDILWVRKSTKRNPD